MKRLMLAALLTLPFTAMANTADLLKTCELYGAAVKAIVEGRDRGVTLTQAIDGIAKVDYEQYGLNKQAIVPVLIADAAQIYRHAEVIQAGPYSQKVQAACVATIPGFRRM